MIFNRDEYEYEELGNFEIESEKIENIKFIDCNFENCSISESLIHNCLFKDCKFTNCNIAGNKFELTVFKDCEFEKCNLIGINWKDITVERGYSNPFSKLKECYLKYSSFIKMDIKKFDFGGNIIHDSMFDESCLKECKFKGCDLTQTRFNICDIRNADFREAKGYLVDITNCKIKGAKFSFPEAMSLLDSLDIKIY